MRPLRHSRLRADARDSAARRRRSPLRWALLAAGLLAPVAAQAGTLVLEPGSPSVALGPAAELLVDPTGELDIEQVQATAHERDFRPVGVTHLGLGTTHAAHWLRFCLTGSLLPTGPDAEREGPMVLYLSPSGSMQADLYRGPPGSCGRRDISDWHRSAVTGLHARAPGHAARVLAWHELPAALTAPTQFYLRVDGEAYLLLAPRVETLEALLSSTRTAAKWHGAYYGVMVAILIVNLLVFLTLRDPRYLWYVAFQTCATAYFLEVEEGLPWLGTSPTGPARYELRSFAPGFVLLGLVAVLAAQFIRSFLDTVRHSPRIDRLLGGYMGLTAVAIGVGLFFDARVQDLTTNALSLLGLAAFVPTLALVRRNPLPNAIFYLAWSCLLGGICFNVATQMGWVPFSMAGFHSHQAGAALEGLLMTFALGERIRSLRAERDRRVAELEQVNASLRTSQHELRALGMQLAVAEEHERRRLAQGLHDQTGQHLAATWMKLQSLQGVELSVGERRLVEECRGLVGEVIEQVRQTTFELSSPLLSSQGLLPALRDLSGRLLGANGLRCDFTCIGDEAGGPAELDIVLYQLAMELFRNVVKHARANAVEVVLMADAEQVSLMVSDDGRGFAVDALPSHTAGGHFGLFSIRERVDYLGGRMEIDSAVGQGCSVTLHVPLRPEGQRAAVTAAGARAVGREEG